MNTEYIKTLDSGVQLEIRSMQWEDIEQVYQLEKKIFISPWSRALFEAELLQQHSYNLVAANENTIVAYTIIWLFVDELHIANLAVKDTWRGCGIATWMMNVIFHIAHENQIKIMHLEVRKSNEPAIKLYKNFGFEIVGCRKNYYEKEKEDAILMSTYINNTVI